ncbi:MAG: metallophosphoesterase [Treponema sp.]|nr:metallophosphoesterase [Treponema sp.]
MRLNNQKNDVFNYEKFAKRHFPVFCVLGNNEPIYGIKKKQEIDAGIGETVYMINEYIFIAYLKRGKVYIIDGIKFLVLGGAFSIDKDCRIPDVTWWKEEYWEEREKKELFKLLETDNSFDCVLSHTGPRFINNELFKFNERFIDEVAILNDKIHNNIQFKYWWSGHWHEDEYFINEETKQRYQYLYRTTKILEKIKNQLIVHNEYGLKNPLF